MPKTPVYIVPFSHLDLFWGGSREECLSRGSHIIRTALDLLEKYEPYRFMLESTNFLEHHLDCFPEDRERLRKFAVAGRLELIPMRSIIYSQLPAGETQVRNLLYGRDDCRQAVGTYSPLLSLSDIPGVTPQTPQIARRAGLSALILSRGCPEHTDQIKWLALDGSSLPTYYPWHYAACCSLLAHTDYARMVAGEEAFERYAGAVDYPQIMHCGTDLFRLDENILNNIARWNADGCRELRFSTFREFFETVPLRPTGECRGEIPSFWPNIESSWPDIWPLDVPCETAMFTAEYFRSLVYLTGGEDESRAALGTAWRWLLDGMDHNQNGCGGEAADADKRRLKVAAAEVARQAAGKCARRLAARATAPRAGAFPIVVFNPLGWKRSELVVGRTAIYGPTFASHGGWGHPFPYRLIDEQGRGVPFRQLDHLNGLTDTLTVEFLAEDIPAFGARTYYLEPGEPEEFAPAAAVTDDRTGRKGNANQPIGGDIYENAHFHLEIDRVTGTLKVFDKRAQRILAEGIYLVALEERGGDYICRMPLSGRTFPALIDRVELVANDAVCCRVRIDGSIYGQRFVQTITLCAGKPEIELETRINWGEIRPVRIEQAFAFPVEWEEPEFRYGVPFGQVRYPETIYSENIPFEKVSLPELGNTSDANIRSLRLINHWISAGDRSGGAVIGADHRMWEFEGRVLRNCLIRGIGHTSGGQHVREDGSRAPTVRPPVGEYGFRFRIAPQAGAKIPDGRVGWELNHPLHCTAVGFSTPAANPGLALPPLPDGSAGTVIVANVKPAEAGGGVVLRCFESVGQESELALPTMAGRSWFETDLLEDNAVPVSGGRLVFRPFEIKTLLAK